MKPGVDFDLVLTISSVEYGCMLESSRGFQKRCINEFAARVSTGPPMYSDSDIYSVVYQEDWRHGLGDPYYSDEYSYAYTGDHVDTRRQGVIQLATKLESVDASAELVNRFVDYTTDAGDACIAACGATDLGIRWTENGTTWSGKADLDDDSTARICYDLLDAGGYIFATQDVSRMQKMASAADPALDASWSDAGNAGNPPNNFEWLAKGGGYLWASEDDTNYIHVAGDTDGADWEGDGTSDAGVIEVGAEDSYITSFCWWNNNMYVGKEDALYLIGSDDVAYRVGVVNVPYKWAHNFKYMTVGPDGALYFVIYDKVYRWIGRTPIDITPGEWGEFPISGYAGGTKPPYTCYTQFRSMARIGNDIVVCGKTNDTTPEWHMLYWTGSGWHKLYVLIASSTYVPYAIYRSRTMNRTYVSLGGTTTTTYAIQQRAGSDLPHALYETGTGGSHYVYFPRISLGLLDIQKYLKSLKLRSFNLNTTQTIDWAYQIDDNDSWYTLGTQNTSPYQSIDFDSTATCRTIQPRAELLTTTGAQTPYLDAYALKMLARPDTVYGYQLTLRVGDKVPNLKKVTGYTPDGGQLLEALETARASVSPITLDTPLEASVSCFVNALARVGLDYDEEGQPYHIVQLSLVAA